VTTDAVILFYVSNERL